MLYRQKESKGRIPTRLDVRTTEPSDVMLFFNIFQRVYKNFTSLSVPTLGLIAKTERYY